MLFRRPQKHAYTSLQWFHNFSKLCCRINIWSVLLQAGQKPYWISFRFVDRIGYLSDLSSQVIFKPVGMHISENAKDRNSPVLRSFHLVFLVCGKNENDNLNHQGSVLAPVLSLIYINSDITQASAFDTTVFADDFNLPLPNSCFNVLQANVNLEQCEIDHWLRANVISLNYNEINFMLLNSDKHNPTWSKVLINNYSISPKHYLKYLCFSWR